MDKLRRQFRRFTQPLLWRLYKGYLSRTRWYRYDGLSIKVAPSVFHPGLLFSTKILSSFVLKLDLIDKHLLELGAGSGLISALASRAGAKVLSTDINLEALASIRASKEKNGLDLKVLESDLFDQIPTQIFDYIIINPPYFPKDASNPREQAFFCGANFEYFHKLYKQLPAYINEKSTVYMILSDDCDVKYISSLAEKAGFVWKEVYQEVIWGETNFIFSIKKQNGR